MSLREHLYDLRSRIGWAILFILIGSVFGFVWYQVDLGPIPSLGQILLKPYCALGPDVRFSPNGKCQLLQTQPFEAFMVNFKVGVGAGMVVSAPLWLYQLWAFITPGLYHKERKFAGIFVFCASFLFVLGGVLAFFVIPQGLAVLVSFGSDTFITALNATSYISFVLVMLLVFGVSFEVPLLIVMLNRVGVLSYANLSRWRRGIIFGVFVFAAFATPGTDPVSMVALAVAMTVLVEFAIQVSRVHDKRKARRLDADDPAAGLSDDEATPLNYRPEPVDQSTLPTEPQPSATTNASSTASGPGTADQGKSGGDDDVT